LRFNDFSSHRNRCTSILQSHPSAAADMKINR
jgi:hypothetical protein